MEALVDAAVPAHEAPRSARWAGRVLTALPVLFLAFDAAMKLALVQPVLDAHERLGFPAALARPIGLVELACLALYLAPRTAVLGAVLLTAHLGGAVAIHARIGDPLVSHTLFPVYVAAMAWGGLFLRDARVRALFAPTR